MKKVLAITFCVFAFFGVRSQGQNPITWQAVYKSISATEGEIIITAKIEKGWHSYSQKVTTDGPVPTTFKFTESKHFTLVGKVEESNVHEEFDKAFGTKIFVVSEKSEFKQKIKLMGTKGANIVVSIEYMCCNDMMCLPPKTMVLTVKTQ